MIDYLSFQQDLLKYFQIKDYKNVICNVKTHLLKRPTIDILAFNDILEERHGKYTEERGLCMNDVIILNYGKKAWEWFVDHLTKPELFKGVD